MTAPGNTRAGSIAERAIALLTERAVAMRGPDIADALGVEPTSIMPCLKTHVERGTLVACLVTSASGRQTYEYRIGAGGKAAGFVEYKPKDTGKRTPPRPVPAAVATGTPAKPKRAYKRSAPVRKVQRNTAISAKRPRVLIKPEKDFRAAPAAGRQLRKFWSELSVPATAAAPGADVRVPHPDAPAATFRTAIASDGAMLFLGAAAGPFELTRAESRALIDFVRTLDRGEVAASPQGGPR